MTTPPNLLPCPFCGGAGMVATEHPDFLDRLLRTPTLYVPQCSSLICPVSLRVIAFESLDRAVRSWNTRNGILPTAATEGGAR